jgi:hypothetical protein
MKNKKVHAIALGNSEEGKQIIDDLAEVQLEIEELTYMKVTKLNALRVLIKHWQKTKGESYV